MITVSGYIETEPGAGASVAYRVGIDAGDPDGPLIGSVNAVSLLRLNVGQEVGLSPVGPFYTLNLADPKTVLAALYALTDVRKVEGDNVPDVYGPRSPDAEN
jgi:hypothetical protein